MKALIFFILKTLEETKLFILNEIVGFTKEEVIYYIKEFSINLYGFLASIIALFIAILVTPFYPFIRLFINISMLIKSKYIIIDNESLELLNNRFNKNTSKYYYVNKLIKENLSKDD